MLDATEVADRDFGETHQGTDADAGSCDDREDDTRRLSRGLGVSRAGIANHAVLRLGVGRLLAGGVFSGPLACARVVACVRIVACG